MPYPDIADESGRIESLHQDLHENTHATLYLPREPRELDLPAACGEGTRQGNGIGHGTPNDSVSAG